MAVDVSGSLPQLELGPGAMIEVDSGNPAAVVTGLTVYGTYYPPGGAPPEQVGPLFIPVALEDQGGG